jgi:hypothetical protein
MTDNYLENLQGLVPRNLIECSFRSSVPEMQFHSTIQECQDIFHLSNNYERDTYLILTSKKHEPGLIFGRKSAEILRSDKFLY